MYTYSDERVEDQVNYINNFLREESLLVGQVISNKPIKSTHNTSVDHSRMIDIMKHITASAESIGDFVFQVSGGLQSRL